MADDQRSRELARRQRVGFWLWAAGIIALFGLMFYQSVNYIGLMHRFAEWQFAQIDRYFPVLSIIAVLVLLYLVWEAGRYLLRRARRRPPEIQRQRRRIAARRSAALFLRCAAVVGAVLAVGTAIQLAQQPSSSGPATEIDLSAGKPARLVAGPVVMTGVRPIGPIARYSEDFLFLRRTRFLAPIGRSSGPGAPYNLFVEARGMDPARDVPDTMRGVLRFDALMPEIRVLYSDAQFPVAGRSAIIFATPGSANRPYLVLIIELLAISGLALLFARHFARSADMQERHLDKVAADTLPIVSG